MVSKKLESLSDEHPEILKSLLNQEGFRLTSQRQKILDLFETTFQGHHLSAEEIQRHLSKQGESISFSTIYRALHVMVNLGLLRELELSEGRKFYELSTPFVEQHHHLVCVQCGTVHEFEDDIITQSSAREAELQGFSLLNCQFTVYGICSECKADLE
jgi:Fur family ferric uptake transcriptional regulator